LAENYVYKQDGSRSVSINELTKEELVQEVLRLRGKLKKKNAFGLVFERQAEDSILNRKINIPVLLCSISMPAATGPISSNSLPAEPGYGFPSFL
jgi:hypothetical protein